MGHSNTEVGRQIVAELRAETMRVRDFRAPRTGGVLPF